MSNEEDWVYELGSASVEEAIEAEIAAEEAAEEAVVEETRTPLLATPEWKAAVKALGKAGFDVDSKSNFFEVRAALVEFQNANGIRGMAEGILTEETLSLLGV